MRLSRHFLLLLSSVFVSGSCFAGEKQVIPRNMNEKIEMISTGSGFFSIELETTLYVPPGTGPFPLVVINHGKALGNPRFDRRARFSEISREFLKRGYLVAIPMRAGYSKSGGVDILGGCNTESTGRVQAKSISAALEKLLERPDVDKSRVLLAGQSYGGIASIAVGSTNPRAVKGIINFAGGVKLTEVSCSWEQALIDAFAAYGKESKIPTLWFYGDNDSFWGAELPKKMHAAYLASGGKAQLVSYGVFSYGDAHAMVSSPKGASIWLPEVIKFLNEIGMPTAEVYEIEITPRPVKTNFAKLADADAVPYLDDRRKEMYRKFLALPNPRAFSIAPTGNVGWSSESADPLGTSLNNCEDFAKVPCSLYAVDDDVVWPIATGAK
jgi:dienelactone hydrolase